MVSRKHKLGMRNALCLAAITVAGALGEQPSAHDQGRRFYADDPLWQEPPPRSVNDVGIRSVDHMYDFLKSSYVTTHREGKLRVGGAACARSKYTGRGSRQFLVHKPAWISPHVHC